MTKLAIPLLALLLAGCSSGAAPGVSSGEEEMFKHPAAVDRSKIPANPFQRKGPAFVGQPSQSTASRLRGG